MSSSSSLPELSLPKAFEPLLSRFSIAFTAPTFQRALALIVGTLLCTGRHTVAAALRVLGPLAPGHHSDYHRVLSRAPWAMRVAAKVLAAAVLELVPEWEDVLLAVDDTAPQHKGKCVFGKGRHRDACRSTRSHIVWVWGHKWIVLTVLVKFPFCSRRWALPVLAALYHAPRKAQEAEGEGQGAKSPNGQKSRKGKKSRKGAKGAKGASGTKSPSGTKGTSGAKVGKGKKKAKGVKERGHKTPIDLGRQLVALLMHWFPDRRFILLGDGGYASHELASFCYRHRRRLTLVSLCHPQANLYTLPPKGKPRTGKGKPGRPRVKGDKMPAPADVVAATTKRKRATVGWYGGGTRRIEFVTGTGHWYKGGDGLVPLRWVFVHDRDGTHRDHYFYCTDPSLEPSRIVGLYTARWSIEVMFQEVRQHLGFHTPRCWRENSVLRTGPCLLGLFSVVCLIYARLARRAQAKAAKGPKEAKGAKGAKGANGATRMKVTSWPWYAKTEPTFSDAIAAVRRSLWCETILKGSGQHQVFQKLPPDLRDTLLEQLCRVT